MLDTLIEAAPAGRRRPTVREAADVVRWGLRARLGRPGSRAVVVYAALVMLAGAYLGAFAGHRAGWEFAPDLPSGQRAERLAATLFPGLHVWGGGDAELFTPHDDGEGIRYGSAGYRVRHTAATRDVGAYSAGVRDRLAAAGWTVHDYAVHEPEDLIDGGAEYRASFRATSPGLVLAFSDHHWTQRPAYDSDGAAAFDLWRAPPPWLTAAGGGTHVKIFVSNTSSPQERALIDAAIFRSRAGSLGELVRQPDSPGFRDTYCGGRRVPREAVAALPYYFDVELAGAATFPALVAEVQGLPGVVAIQRGR